jgi:fatty-acyl-CoA synthase
VRVNIAAVLEHHVDRFPDRKAVGFGDAIETWTELHLRSRTTAGALCEAGVGPGDVVGVLLYNSLDVVALMYGIAHLGAIFMPLNWRLAKPELSYIVEHAGAVALVSEPELEPLVDTAGLGCRFVRVAATGDSAWMGLDELRGAASDPGPPARVGANDVHRLMYTSGTTARPKGVMITYGNVDAKCWAQVTELGLTRDDRGLVAGPLYHVGALDLTFTNMLHLAGYTRILRKFDATEVLDAIEAEQLTNLWLAPAMVNLVLAEPSLDSRDLSSVRILIDGGEKMPLPLIERVLAVFPNAWFADAYGLTETVGGDTFLNKGEQRRKLGSVGKAVIHAEILVADLDGRPVPAGETGEILIRGPKVFAGYWKDPEASGRALRDGWFHSGDVGVLDEEGFLYIVDRLKDMIVSGGENVASLEVERALYEHEHVVEAAVIGRPDERWGEIPVAYVVLQEGSAATETELIEFCRERLARYKVPKAVRTLDALPRNPSGKVLKRELRDLDREQAVVLAGGVR